MTSYDAGDLRTLLGIAAADIELSIIERVMDVGIGLLNIFGAGLSELGGSAGSKTVSLEGPEWAAVSQISRMVYADNYEDSGGTIEIGDITVEARDYLSDPKFIGVVKEFAHELQTQDSSAYDNIILL